LNVTVPVGVPDDVETVAVKVTLCPETLGLSEEATAVVVKPLMVNVTVAVVAEPLPLVNTAR
jgi:hypothetical protein